MQLILSQLCINNDNWGDNLQREPYKAEQVAPFNVCFCVDLTLNHNRLQNRLMKVFMRMLLNPTSWDYLCNFYVKVIQAHHQISQIKFCNKMYVWMRLFLKNHNSRVPEYAVTGF